MEWRFKKSEDEKHIKINWEEEAASRLLGSLKSNVPKATEAIYDYVNKYYLGNASSELRRSLQKNAEGARRKMDELNMDFQRAARDAYREWKNKTQNLYEEVLAQEGQSIPASLQKMVGDSLVYVTHKYHMAVTFLTDSFINFLKDNTFQLPGNAGTYTADELCTMVMRETVKPLSQFYSVILRDFYSEHSVRATDFASKITTQVEQFLSRNIQEYLSILADIIGKGKEKIAELPEAIKSWATAMKEIISEYHQQSSSKLQDFSDQFSDYYEKFIDESTRLIDLSIQSYHIFLKYITEFLKELQVATAN
ncbi:hypothetical protein A6R68_10399, partial [Neotoma lepida]